jgi:outer membrane protein assembly factor BamB
VVHGGKRYAFSQHDRDAFGKEIGVDRAQELAQKKAEEIKSLLQAASQAEAVAPPVEKHVIPRITIYATSERGLVHALSGETGQTLWTTQVGNPLYPTSAPAANDKLLAVCNGSTLYVLRTSDGSVAWSRPTMGVPGAGPAMSFEYVFVPMVSGHVEAIQLADPKFPAGVYKSFGRVMVQPVISSNSVAWPTDSGNLYVGLAHDPGIRFRMQATDAITAAPAFAPPHKVFTASLDGYIYCLNEEKGNIIWRFTTGEPITESPVALSDIVLAITKRGNLYAIDAANAVELWVAGGIRRYLAASSKRLYCLDSRGELAVLDIETGSRLATFPGIASDMPLMNTQTDRIVLVSSTGLIQCLREADQPWPLIHYLIDPPVRAVRATPKAGQPKAGEKAAPPPTTDPFGGQPPAGGAAPVADPFAAPPAARPAAPAGADPFAAP